MGPGCTLVHSKFSHFCARKLCSCRYVPLSSHVLGIVLTDTPALRFYRQTLQYCCDPSQIRS